MIIEMIFWLLCIVVFYNFNVSLHNDTMYQFKSIDDGIVRGVSVILGNKDTEEGIKGALKRNIRISSRSIWY